MKKIQISLLVISSLAFLTSCYKADRNQKIQLYEENTFKSSLKGIWQVKTLLKETGEEREFSGTIDPSVPYNDSIIVWKLMHDYTSGAIAVLNSDSTIVIQSQKFNSEKRFIEGLGKIMVNPQTNKLRIVWEYKVTYPQINKENNYLSYWDK